MAELGKVDHGGGGTVALYLAAYGMDTIDLGPAVLGEGPGQSEAHGAGFIGAARHLAADDHRAVHFADQAFQFEGAVVKHFRMSGDGNLTAAVEPGEQAAFGFHADAGRTVFHER